MVSYIRPITDRKVVFRSTIREAFPFCSSSASRCHRCQVTVLVSSRLRNELSTIASFVMVLLFTADTAILAFRYSLSGYIVYYTLPLASCFRAGPPRTRWRRSSPPWPAAGTRTRTQSNSNRPLLTFKNVNVHTYVYTLPGLPLENAASHQLEALEGGASVKAAPSWRLAGS
jgi:hypothetical protein